MIQQFLSNLNILLKFAYHDGTITRKFKYFIETRSL
jgi:hypothetical protein